MDNRISVLVIREALLNLFDEVTVDGYHFMLDRGASLLETLASINAEEASTPVSNHNASIAAQVNHIRYYIEDALDRPDEADWEGSWRIGPVNDAEWEDLIARLRSAVERARGYFSVSDDWDEHRLAKGIAIIAHCAYHLGEIRQGIEVIRSRAR